VSSDAFQLAKVFAGELQHTTEEHGKLGSKLQANVDISAKLAFANMLDHQANVRAQDLTATMVKQTTDAEAAVEELTALSKTASPVNKDLTGSPSKQYYSIMYFVDKAFQSIPSTCGGDVDKKPMVGLSVDECASACDNEVLTCVGYSYYPENTGTDTSSFCFLFSRFKQVTYYSDCGKSFLQQPADLSERPHPTCYAKLSDFATTDLKPDPSGKCTTCLESATKADRCYK